MARYTWTDIKAIIELARRPKSDPGYAIYSPYGIDGLSVSDVTQLEEIASGGGRSERLSIRAKIAAYKTVNYEKREAILSNKSVPSIFYPRNENAHPAMHIMAGLMGVLCADSVAMLLGNIFPIPYTAPLTPGLNIFASAVGMVSAAATGGMVRTLFDGYKEMRTRYKQAKAYLKLPSYARETVRESTRAVMGSRWFKETPKDLRIIDGSVRRRTYNGWTDHRTYDRDQGYVEVSSPQLDAARAISHRHPAKNSPVALTRDLFGSPPLSH
jgi:hypothetical protein